MATKPVARQVQRDIIRKSKYLKDDKNRPIEEHVGIEYVRTGTCPKHHSPSTSFFGVNEHGWIFRCTGRGVNVPDGVPHYYTNRAP